MLSEEAKFQIKREIDGIINDSMRINVRVKRLEERYGIQIKVSPESDYWCIGRDGEPQCFTGGAGIQSFRGGQELADALKSDTYVDKIYGDRRLNFKYRECKFVQWAAGNATFRRAYRRRNRYTKAVNESVDE